MSKKAKIKLLERLLQYIIVGFILIGCSSTRSPTPDTVAIWTELVRANRLDDARTLLNNDQSVINQWRKETVQKFRLPITRYSRGGDLEKASGYWRIHFNPSDVTPCLTIRDNGDGTLTIIEPIYYECPAIDTPPTPLK